MHFLRLFACSLALAVTKPAISAQPAYPSKPIRLIVPIAAGSVTDVIIRAASQELSKRLGQPLVIDNRTGASGILSAEACAKATPDGYTLCAIYTATTSVNLRVSRKPGSRACGLNARGLRGISQSGSRVDRESDQAIETCAAVSNNDRARDSLRSPRQSLS